MGTRGTWGFVLDQEEKLTYNHFDSYPEGLGVDLVAWLREQDIEALKDQVRALRLVDDDTPPTQEEIARAKGLELHDGNVSTGSEVEWYSLLRGAQGDPGLTLTMGCMEEGNAFAMDSLFCEWGYVIDLDNERLEVYKGFQTAPHERGRFAGRGGGRESVGSTYYPIAEVGSFDLRSLPTPDEFVAQINQIVAPEDEEVEA